jgi:hypothetical protein
MSKPRTSRRLLRIVFQGPGVTGPEQAPLGWVAKDACIFAAGAREGAPSPCKPIRGNTNSAAVSFRWFGRLRESVYNYICNSLS